MGILIMFFSTYISPMKPTDFLWYEDNIDRYIECHPKKVARCINDVEERIDCDIRDCYIEQRPLQVRMFAKEIILTKLKNTLNPKRNERIVSRKIKDITITKKYKEAECAEWMWILVPVSIYKKYIPYRKEEIMDLSFYNDLDGCDTWCGCC